MSACLKEKLLKTAGITVKLWLSWILSFVEALHHFFKKQLSFSAFSEIMHSFCDTKTNFFFKINLFLLHYSGSFKTIHKPCFGGGLMPTFEAFALFLRLFKVKQETKYSQLTQAIILSRNLKCPNSILIQNLISTINRNQSRPVSLTLPERSSFLESNTLFDLGETDTQEHTNTIRSKHCVPANLPTSPLFKLGMETSSLPVFIL